jgi:NADP-dependent 3-hydroxy acid dehydrogenase YdfG
MAALKVFITGASSGIGQALAQEYASQGATLGLVARREVLLKSLREQFNTPCSIYAADVRDEEAMQAAAKDFISKYNCLCDSLCGIWYT